MKTRVIEWYAYAWGVNAYAVEKWARYDDPDLAEFTKGKEDEWDWRHVTVVLDKDKAIALAKQVAANPEKKPVSVVWESQ